MTVTGTYRLQLHEGFGFADAQAQLPYLASLGVSHLYLSPVLQAVPGSMHGYDVLDHTRVCEDLGGEEGLRARSPQPPASTTSASSSTSCPTTWRWSRRSRANAPLWACCAHGRDAAHAHWFDIDWESGDGRLGLPVLGSTLAETLEAGDLRLGELDGQPVHPLPRARLPGRARHRGRRRRRGRRPAQHYQLASWRERDAMLNYRRFFEVDQLIAVRVELPDVFEATHRVLLGAQPRRRRRGLPHRPPRRAGRPRGLPRPGCARRPAPAPRSGSRRSSRAPSGCPPPGPATAPPGTTPMQAIQAALVDPATAPVLDRAWEETGGQPTLEHVVDASKRQVVAESLGPERRATDPPGPRGPARRRTPSGSRRPSSSCSSPARSTAPTSTPTSGRRPLARSGSRTRSSVRWRPAPTSSPSSSS